MTSQAFVVRTETQRWAGRIHGAALLLLLLATLLLGLGSSIHSRLLAGGEQLWDNYYLLDPTASAPTCDPSPDMAAEIEQALSAAAADEFALFQTQPDVDSLRLSIKRNAALCQRKHAGFEAMQGQITPMLIAFKTVEKALADWLLGHIDLSKYLFIMIMGLAAATAAFYNEHIGLRMPQSRAEWRFSQASQLVVNGLMVFSFTTFNDHLIRIPDTEDLQFLQRSWSLVFGLLMAVNLARLVSVPERLNRKPLGPATLLSVPLYCYMGAITFLFFLTDAQPSGPANSFNQMTSLSSMFVNIALYVFVGMTLKQTRIPHLLLDILKPWNLPPAALASLVIFATAFPTAFTGASGIFILAVGGILYDELRRAGAGRQLSLATTAMSGSMGVVLNPCLLIVIIAALNKEVTTAQLYGWGFWVFLFSALLFTLVVCTTEGRWKPRPVSVRGALGESLRSLRPLLRYLLAAAVTLIGFWGLLDVTINEYSAPMILPIIMLALVFTDTAGSANRLRQLAGRTMAAAAESAVHIGALLSLIGLSICLGGVLERSEFVYMLFPETLQSVWLVMLSIVVLLTFVGMIMDPFGAAVLVSATVASVAMDMGIDPVHFWIVTLVAFELGYLTPPVALNHLLTRQVVGETEVLAAEKTGSFWERYQRLLLPLVVMGTTLLVVAFVPLFFYE